ncbi:hypothetical protein ABLN67_11775 [Mycobacterium tuberculosis]
MFNRFIYRREWVFAFIVRNAFAFFVRHFKTIGKLISYLPNRAANAASVPCGLRCWC